MELYKNTKTKLTKKMKQIMKHFANNLQQQNTRISPHNIGIIIRSIHLCSPIYIFIILFLGTQTLCNIMIFFITIGAIAFYIFDCCFLSVLEKELCKDNFVVMDPLLELLGIEVNSRNRVKTTTQILWPSLFISMFFIYYIRFIHSNTHQTAHTHTNNFKN